MTINVWLFSIKVIRWDASLAVWILVKVTTRFIEALYFLSLIGNGNDPDIYPGNFCLAPQWRFNWPQWI